MLLYPRENIGVQPRYRTRESITDTNGMLSLAGSALCDCRTGFAIVIFFRFGGRIATSRFRIKIAHVRHIACFLDTRVYDRALLSNGARPPPIIFLPSYRTDLSKSTNG